MQELERLKIKSADGMKDNILKKAMLGKELKKLKSLILDNFYKNDNIPLSYIKKFVKKYPDL